MASYIQRRKFLAVLGGAAGVAARGARAPMSPSQRLHDCEPRGDADHWVDGQAIKP
jgi:hypothetical protein